MNREKGEGSALRGPHLETRLMNPPYDECLTATELAERLHVTPSTILRWHRAGKIPATRITAKVLRFGFRDVLAALKTDAGKGGVV